MLFTEDGFEQISDEIFVPSGSLWCSGCFPNMFNGLHSLFSWGLWKKRTFSWAWWQFARWWLSPCQGSMCVSALAPLSPAPAGCGWRWSPVHTGGAQLWPCRVCVGCSGLPHGERGLKQQIAQLGAWGRSAPEGPPVISTDEELSQASLLKAGTEFRWNRLMDLFSFVHFVLQNRNCLVYGRYQEGFAWLGNQTLWVNLRAGCPGGSEPQRSICSGQQHAIRGCVEKQQPKWHYWEGVLHLCFMQGCFSWCWRAAGESSACPILGTELLTEPLGTRLHLAGLHWIFIPLKYGTSGAFGAVCVHCTNCRQFKQAFQLLLKDGNGVYLLVSGVVESVQTACVHLSSCVRWTRVGKCAPSQPSHHTCMRVCAESALVDLRRSLLWNPLCLPSLWP